VPPQALEYIEKRAFGANGPANWNEFQLELQVTPPNVFYISLHIMQKNIQLHTYVLHTIIVK